MDGKVLPYHWDDRVKLENDYKYVQEVYERILPALAERLNRIHDVRHGMRYWRILIGPWLSYFIQTVFDRWESIRIASNNVNIIGTCILECCDSDIVPKDMWQFIGLFQGDPWNHYIYSEIILETQRIPFNRKKISTAAHTHGRMTGKVAHSRHRLKNWYLKLIRTFRSDDVYFVHEPYLSRSKEMQLHFQLGQIPHTRPRITPTRTNFDASRRTWSMVGGDEVQNCFEQFILKLIPKQLPQVYLEGYLDLTRQLTNLSWPKAPKLLFTSNSLWHDDVVMAYSAEKIEQGACLVYGQHGGGYGTAKFHFAEEHEIRIADCYLTMGWTAESTTTAESTAKIVPIGFFKYKKARTYLSRKKDKLLLITLDLPRYSFRLCSETALNVESYFQRVFSFAESLDDLLKSSMIVRLSSRETDVGQQQRWLERFPGVDLELGVEPIYRLMRKSKLVVLTYNQTSILETLAYGIPTILFCDLEVTPLRESAIPFYDALKRVGIFHDTPESATSFIHSIWNDLDSWWNSVELQQVVTAYTNSYCRRSTTVVKDIKKVLEETVRNGCPIE